MASPCIAPLSNLGSTMGAVDGETEAFPRRSGLTQLSQPFLRLQGTLLAMNQLLISLHPAEMDVPKSRAPCAASVLNIIQIPYACVKLIEDAKRFCEGHFKVTIQA